MTSFIVTCAILLILVIYFEILKEKLFKLLEISPHKDLIAKMYLPKNILKPFRKPDWTPVKYVFKRTHRELKNKPLSNLCDLILILYLLIWCVSFYFVLQMNVLFH